MALVIKDLNKEFGAKAVFSGFNYTFEDSGLYVVSGESGIGKTTLLRLIAGLDTEFKGKINNFGNKPSMLFQEYRLFPHLTALENIVLTVSNTKSEAVTRSRRNWRVPVPCTWSGSAMMWRTSMRGSREAAGS